jgi:hypothetical protein
VHAVEGLAAGQGEEGEEEDEDEVLEHGLHGGVWFAVYACNGDVVKGHERVCGGVKRKKEGEARKGDWLPLLLA